MKQHDYPMLLIAEHCSGLLIDTEIETREGCFSEVW
jgi:hypothetical protein